MTSPYSAVRCLAEMPGGDYGFSIWGHGGREPLEKVLAPNYFLDARQVMRDGDLIVINDLPPRLGGRPPARGRKVLAMLHKDRDGFITTTKLLELPHDPVELAARMTRLAAVFDDTVPEPGQVPAPEAKAALPARKRPTRLPAPE